MTSNIDLLGENKENDKNTINKCEELAELEDSVHHSKMHDRTANKENISTVHTEISTSGNYSESDLKGTNVTSNINESHNNINCITNESNIQNTVREDTNKVYVDCGSEKNDCNVESIINTHEIINTSKESEDKALNIQNSSDNVSLVHEKLVNVIDGDNRMNDRMSCKRKTYKRKNIIFDSDSDEDTIPLDKNTKAINLAPAYCIDDKGKVIPETDIGSQSLRICDPESSDDDRSDNHEDYSEPLTETTVKRDIKKHKERSSNPEKKITGRDAAKLRKEITSESQRRTRECAVNLPYHKPKVRTLKEFLQNRPRFATTIPTSTSNTPPSIAIKMLSEHLEMISEKLSEREKKVEEFFKSESESEEETENINIRTEEKNANIKPEISEEFENNSQEVVESEQKEDQSEKINNPRESRVILLQNILLNSNADIETENNKVVLSENAQELSQTEQVNTQATMEAETFDADTQSHESVIKSNGELENKNCDPDSPQYEFTMNDVSSEEDENEEVLNSETDKVNKLIDKYTSIDVTKEIANMPVNLEECNKEDILTGQSKNIPHLNLVEMSSIKPELKGSPGLVIDLEDGSTKLSDVNMLMDRFFRHNKKKAPQRNKVKLDIISVSGGEIHKETVEVPTHDEETITINEKPGERLKKLRNELETQMAQRRSQLWLEKSNLKVKSEESDGKKNDAHIECKTDDMLDDEDEGEFTNSEEEEEEDDEEDIICGEDNYDEGIDEGESKQKSVFVDEEAEESDLEDDDNSVTCNEDLIGYSEPCHSETIDDNGDETNQQSQYNSEEKQKKKLKRILKPFSNDSDDEDSTLDNTVDQKIDTFASNTTNTESNKEYVLDSTDTWDESDPTPYQPRNSCTPSKVQTQSKLELGFLTPVVQLTGLQSLNSGSKFLHESPISPFVMPIDSPTRSFTHSGPQKRLFTDSDLTTTQEMSEVAELCSGKFPSQTQETYDASKSETISGNTSKTSNHTTEETPSPIQDEPSTQDLLELCSGKFTGITQSDKIERNDKTNENNKLTPIESSIGNSNLIFNLTEISISNDEVKNLDTEDKLISQLLDEEEMENFKKKFDSPSNENDSSLKAFPRVIYDSSDDEDDLLTKRKPKKQRKLVFSDDESSNSCDQEDMLDEDSDVTDFCNNVNDEQELEDDNVPETVEYDSEENEISTNMKDKPKKMKIGDFLENEAELSESEWGSADEDEGGLDELEIEEGDKDQLDENKIKADLERIHIRRILDDDNQELKVLQELLLDDGELHGSGRARQFRWKNIDSVGNDVDASHQEEGEIYLDDENEDEERWRKMRYEREEFLKKQMEKSQMVNIEEYDAVNTNSQVLKLGQKALIRQISNTSNASVISEKKIPAPVSEVKAPVLLLCKRGSFLTRSDQVLARVAEFTKTITPVVGGVKKAKNFVFQTLSESTDVISLSNKRKATESTPKAIKRLRLNNVSPAIHKSDRKFNGPQGGAV